MRLEQALLVVGDHRHALRRPVVLVRRARRLYPRLDVARHPTARRPRRATMRQPRATLARPCHLPITRSLMLRLCVYQHRRPLHPAHVPQPHPPILRPAHHEPSIPIRARHVRRQVHDLRAVHPRVTPEIQPDEQRAHVGRWRGQRVVSLHALRRPAVPTRKTSVGVSRAPRVTRIHERSDRSRRALLRIDARLLLGLWGRLGCRRRRPRDEALHQHRLLNVPHLDQRRRRRLQTAFPRLHSNHHPAPLAFRWVHDALVYPRRSASTRPTHLPTLEQQSKPLVPEREHPRRRTHKDPRPFSIHTHTRDRAEMAGILQPLQHTHRP